MIYEGRRNAYTFSMGTKKFTLLPSVSSSPIQPGPKPIMLLNRVNFMRELHTTTAAFMLIPQPLLLLSTEFIQLTRLLNEFADVFPEELPHGFPP